MSTIDLANRRRQHTRGSVIEPTGAGSPVASRPGLDLGRRLGRRALAHARIQIQGRPEETGPRATGPGLAEVIVIAVPRKETTMTRPPLQAATAPGVPALAAALRGPRTTPRSVIARAARSALTVAKTPSRAHVAPAAGGFQVPSAVPAGIASVSILRPLAPVA